MTSGGATATGAEGRGARRARRARRSVLRAGAVLATLSGTLGVAAAGCGQTATPGAGGAAPATPGSAPPVPVVPAAATAAWSAPQRLPATVTDAAGQVVTVTSGERLVGLGGSVTETLYALGLGERLVGADTSSTYPPDVERLPRTGYVRTLSAEGVLSLRPTAILGTEEAGPPAALEQLRGAGTALVLAPDPPTLAAPGLKIDLLSRALGVPERGKALLAQLEAELARARQEAATPAGRARPRVLFLYVRAGGAQSAAGRDTQTGAMIEGAGGINAGAEAGLAGYQPITAEAVVAARPDVYLAFSRGLEAVGGVDGLLQIPGLAQTPAGMARRVVHLEDLYLGGMGPRTGQALLDLAQALRG